MKTLNLNFVSLRESKDSLATRILQWRHRVRTRRQLLDLDDRLLSDIGLTRYDVLHSKSLLSDLSSHNER
jgi:uncharacterized protein YjiS (DUF1127 family)